jgi:hypothetical protein
MDFIICMKLPFWHRSIENVTYYRVSRLTRNPPLQYAAAAASELPENELVTTQNTAVLC